MKRFTVLLAFLVFVFSGIFAQNVQITGNVTGSEDGAPLPGVSVVVKGTTVGTVTDFNGYYVLSVPESATTLVFSFVGMRTQEVAIEGRTTVNVVLEPDALDLEEVVVTAIGIKREAKALGYSVQNVSSEEIENSENISVLNSLSGKVAGVTITNSSGAAGAATFIEIRGASSLTGSNRPLFVIDGVPIQGGGGTYGVDGVAVSDRAIDINPDDIQDITVLKGGAATALYGLRAANGAIVITTKRGAVGAAKKTTVEFNTSVTVENISQVYDLQDKYAQGSETYAEYLDWVVDFYYGSQVEHSRVASPADGAPYRNLAWGPAVSELSYTTDPNFTDSGDGWYYSYIPMDEYLTKWDPNGRIVPATSSFANGQPVKTYDQYDYFQTGITYNNNLSLSGGNDNTTYFFSVSNVNSKGVIPNNTYNKTTFKISADTKLSDKFTTGASVNYITTDANRIQQGSNISGVMLGLVRTPPTFNNAGGYEFPDGRQRTYRGGGGYDNPYWVSNNIAYEDDLHRMIGNINFNYFAAPWLSFTYRLGTDTYTTSVKDRFAKFSNAFPAGYVYTDRYTATDINSDLLANINTSLTEDLDLSITLGQNMYQRRTNYVSGVANGIDIPGFYNMRNSSDVTPNEGTFEKRTAAFFGDFGLSFQDMIFLNFTDRLEWSTTLPVEETPFNYWSLSGGFVFTELPMLKDNAVLPFGKLRASYAQVANDATAYSNATYWFQAGTADGWTTGVSFPFSNPLGSFGGFSYSGTLGDPLLRPELQSTFEIGADLRFFNGRFAVDVAYYKNINEDLLLSIPVASSSGFAARYTNAGTMETEGIELLVNLTPVKTNDFSWDITATWSNPVSTVTKLAEGVESIFLGGFVDPQIRAVAGDPYRSIYGTRLLRAETGELIINDDASLEDPALNPYANYNRGIYGYPMMDETVAPLGTVQPDWVAGITNTFSFAGFRLSALLEIKKGGLMWNGTKGALYYFGTHGDTESRDDDPYVHEGLRGHVNSAGEIVHYADPENGDFTEIPGPGAANSVARADDEYYRFWSGIGSGFTGPAEPYIEETDWVRLREVTLSYTLSPKILQGTFISKLDVYVTGRNLFLSTPYTGIDPETSLLGNSNGQGMDYFNMPGTKAVSFGLRLGF
jgi:TonB-linked SusC/RagA family outer membrane protein